jgi:Domain of unknown function (DUF4149)
MPDRLPILLAALWWGSLTTLGFLVVPMLFAHLPTPAVAGGMAAKLFGAQTWVSLACGLLLLMFSRSRWADSRLDWTGSMLLLMAAGMLLALLSEFAVSPRIVARENLKLWHGVGSVLYGLQWLSASALLWKLARRRA